MRGRQGTPSGRVSLLVALLAALTTVLAGCSDWPNGLPVLIKIANWTDQPISIERQPRGESATVILDRIEPRTLRAIETNESHPACRPGIYIARDAAGVEIARAETQWCSAWVVAPSGVPVLLANRTDSVVKITYSGFRKVEIGSLKPGESLNSTVDEFGDPSELCLGGELSVAIGSNPERSSGVRDCSAWVWTIQAVTESMARELAQEWLAERLPSDALFQSADANTRTVGDGLWDVSSRVEVESQSLGPGTFQVCLHVTIDQQTGWITKQGQYGPVPMNSPTDKCGY